MSLAQEPVRPDTTPAPETAPGPSAVEPAAGPGTPAESAEQRKSRIPWYDLFKHPMLLLVIGALVSSYLIPSFTRQWQDQQKALQLKTDLATEINTDSTDILTQIQVLQFPDFGLTTDPTSARKAVAAHYQTWMDKGAAIEGELESYFPDSNIANDWHEFYALVQNFALLSLETDPFKRADSVAKIQTYFTNYNVPDHVAWDRLLGSAKPTLSKSGLVEMDEATWNQVDNVVVGQRRALVQEILQSSVSTF